MSKFISAEVSEDDANPYWIEITIRPSDDWEYEDFTLYFPYEYDEDGNLHIVEEYAWRGYDDYPEYFDDEEEFHQLLDYESLNDIFYSNIEEIEKAIKFREERDKFVLSIAPSLINEIEPNYRYDDCNVYVFTHENYPNKELMVCHWLADNTFTIPLPEGCGPEEYELNGFDSEEVYEAFLHAINKNT